MTTLTPTAARANLTEILRQALAGDDIGIVVNGRVVALRPVTVVASDYVETEYDLSPVEWKGAARRLHEKARKNFRSGKARQFRGNIEALLAVRH
ncbi:MAG TPA: hypothetical protein VGH65_02940 [Verrucomicrobiaceae bacterium]|jgi:antitoxin (DNA-binding transcriptional repressor) of toxin-antitoxin stability system